MIKGLVGIINGLVTKHWGIIKFAVVGGSGTLISLSSLYIFTEYIGLYYLISYLIAGTLAITSNYIWHTLWTFQKRTGLTGYIKYFVLSWITAGAIKTFIIWSLTELGLWYMLSAFIATLIGFAVNYFYSRKKIWKK